MNVLRGRRRGRVGCAFVGVVAAMLGAVDARAQSGPRGAESGLFPLTEGTT